MRYKCNGCEVAKRDRGMGQLQGLQKSRYAMERHCCKASAGAKTEKRILFLKNKPGKLLKIKDNPKKQTGNKAETKLPKLLKKKKGPKKQTENKPETKLAMLLKIKRRQKTNRNILSHSVQHRSCRVPLQGFQVTDKLYSPAAGIYACSRAAWTHARNRTGRMRWLESRAYRAWRAI